MDKEEFLQNISDKDTIQNHLTFMALYIALYENFKATFVENVKSFLCDLGIKDGELNYRETPLYREKVKNRHKNILIATMLWLQDEGAMSAQDYSDFLKIRSIRNNYAHEMPRLIIEGVPQDDIQWFFKLLELYEKLDKWWIDEIEIPASGEFLPGTYDENDVENLMLSAFKCVIASLYLDRGSSELKGDDKKA